MYLRQHQHPELPTLNMFPAKDFNSGLEEEREEGRS